MPTRPPDRRRHQPFNLVPLGTDDRPIGRVDLLLEDPKLILEYEGGQHRIDLEQWNVDIGRGRRAAMRIRPLLHPRVVRPFRELVR